MNNKNSQTKEIIQYLRKYKKITSQTAFKSFGATRLSSIIFSLRERGYGIETEMAQCKNRYGQSTNYAIYHLVIPDAVRIFLLRETVYGKKVIN